MHVEQQDVVESDGRDFNPLIQSRKSLYIISSGFMLYYAALLGLLSLESSINVEEGLGTTSVMVIFITSSISSILFIPFIIDYFGAKTATIVGEIGVVVYIAANFYPSWYTLIPAAIIHGLTESCPWAGSCVYVTYLGEQRWMKRNGSSLRIKEKPKESYIYRFFGHFFSFFYVGNIIGYGLIFLVLLAFEKPRVNNDSTNIGTDNVTNVTETMVLNTSFAPTLAVDDDYNPMEKCGAQDCQAEYIHGTAEELEKFNPNPISTYLLLSIFVALVVIAVVIQIIFLPRAPAKYDEIRKSRKKVTELVSTETKVVETEKVPSITNDVINTLQQTARHVISPLHLLVAPMLFYHGVYVGYVITEYTRAYVSCIVGVEKLGIGLTVIAVTSVVFSSISAWILRTLGRMWFFAIVGGTHMAVYLFSLFWLPNPANSWMTYLLAVIVGVGDSIIMQCGQSLIAVYFHDRVGIAFGVKNCITNLGIVAVTGWSTSLCVYVKIYLQIGILIISLICLVGGEALFKRKFKTEIESAI